MFQRTQGFSLCLHYRFLRSQPTIAFGIQQGKRGVSPYNYESANRESCVCLNKTFIPFNIIKTVKFNLIVKLAHQPPTHQTLHLPKSLAYIQGGAGGGDFVKGQRWEIYTLIAS